MALIYTTDIPLTCYIGIFLHKNAQKCVAIATNNNIVVKILYTCSLLYFFTYWGNISFLVSGAQLCNCFN
jgi:hypothetical protein